MFERQVSVADLRSILDAGVVIEEYPQDTPYLSRLVLGFRRLRPLHVVGKQS
jgi:hypothetical protein